MAFKSEKDKEAYVNKLKAAGFAPDEIDADVAEIEASQPAPAAVAPPPSAAAPAAPQSAAPPPAPPVAQTNLQPDTPAQLVGKLAEVAQARDDQNQDLTGQVLGNELTQAIKDLSGSDLGKVGLAAAGGYGLYKAGRLAERKFGPSGEVDVSRRVEPTMESPKESSRLPQAAQQSGVSPDEQALLDRSEANRIAKEQDAARRAAATPPAQTPEPPAFIRNQPVAETLAGAVAPPAAPAAPERIVSGVKMTEPQYQYYINESTPGLSPAQAIEEMNAKAAMPAAPVAETPALPRSRTEFLTELDAKNGPLPSGRSSVSVMEEIMPAAPTAETPKGSVPPEEKKKGGRPSAKSMEGTTFRPDLGPGDNWLYNTAGPDRRKAILAEFNEGKPAKDYKTAQELYKKYQEKYPKDMFGPVIPVEQAKARGIKPPENYGALGKVAKVGGVAGLALTAAELANAAQQSQKGNDAPLRETIFNLLGMIPGVGTAFTAGTYAGGTNEGEMQELARRRQMAPEITRR
jgi:hypothetical protein